MPIEDFYDHKCDIFHMLRSEKSPGFGLPSGSDFSYPEAPDLTGVSCHFGVKASTIAIIQRDPQTGMEGKIKLTLPAGTDIRINDKVVDTDTGAEYTAEVPRNIRGHHITAMLRRTEAQKPL